MIFTAENAKDAETQNKNGRVEGMGATSPPPPLSHSFLCALSDLCGGRTYCLFVSWKSAVIVAPISGFSMT
jgi:hypothetical protein